MWTSLLADARVILFVVGLGLLCLCVHLQHKLAGAQKEVESLLEANARLRSAHSASVVAGGALSVVAQTDIARRIAIDEMLPCAADAPLEINDAQGLKLVQSYNDMFVFPTR